MAKIAGLFKKENGRQASAQNSNAAEVQKLAYQFFVERGCENGHDLEDWLRAEAIVKNRKS